MNASLRLRSLPAIAAAAILVAAVSLSSASASGQRGGAIPLLRMGVLGPLPSVDRNRQGSLAAYPVSTLGLEDLVGVTPTGKLIPWLAESVTRPGRNVLVYHLRHGVRFWDGSEMTSADVANAMNYTRYPTFGLSAVYSSIKTIVPKDKYTVVVTFKHPDNTWADYSAIHTAIFEKKFQQEHGATMGQAGVLEMGTGPWEFSSLDPTSGIELTANPHYWGGPVGIQHISIKLFSDENSAALAMRAGAIDGFLYLQDVKGFRAAAGSNADIVSSPGAFLTYLRININIAPWNDVHVRRAVAYALDRSQLISVYGSPALPTSTMILPFQLQQIATPAQVAAMLKTVPTYPYSVAKARAELAKSAYPNGFSATIDTDSVHANLMQAIAGQLGKIGIKLTVDQVPPNTASAEQLATDNPKAGLATIGLGATLDPGAYPHYTLTRKTYGNAPSGIFYETPAVDALITQGETETNDAKRFAIYTKMLRIVGTSEPVVALFSPDVNEAISNKFVWKKLNPESLFASPPWALGISAK
jgi:peptide/nickel transport system substrate-binding protein